ncbi:MAG: hypothetical protein AAFV26_10925 [Pseudomonadota bacterium]
MAAGNNTGRDRMRKVNAVVRVSYAGGLLGLFFGSSRGKIEKVIVGVGGFLGMGERSVAITMEQLQFTRGDNDSLTVKTQLTKNELTALPVWEPQQG